MKVKNCKVGQRVEVKYLIGMDEDFFSLGDKGVIMRTEDDPDGEGLRIFLRFDGLKGTCHRFLYPRQLRKVKGDAS